MRATSHDRLTAETGEEREARLQQMSAQQRDRLASETAEERDNRLQYYSVRHREQIMVQSQLPLRPFLPPSLSHAHSALHPSHLRNKVQNPSFLSWPHAEMPAYEAI